MKFRIYFYYVAVIFTSPVSALPKSLYENQFNLRDDESRIYPVKRKVPNPEQPNFVAAHEESADLDDSPVSEDQSRARYRRVEEPLSDSAVSSLTASNAPLQPVYERKSQAALEKELDLKRTSLMNGLGKRADRLYKRDLRPQRREDSYGIVYENGRPVGILEPFPQAYEFAPLYSSREGIEEIEPLPQVNSRRSVMDVLYPIDRLSSNAQLNNEWEVNENNLQDPAKYTDDKSALNDFKTVRRLNDGNAYKRNSKEAERIMKTRNTETLTSSKQSLHPAVDQIQENSDLTQKKAIEVKRSIAGITNKKIAELKSALNRIQNPGPSDKVEEIEDNLRDILNDMGLIEGEYSGVDSYKNKRKTETKREADKEDENLEEGANKIELVKVTHDSPKIERNKREDKKETKDKDVDKVKSNEVPDVSLSKEQEVANKNNKAESNEAKFEGFSPVKSESSSKSESNDEDVEVVDEDQDSEVKRSNSKIDVANYQSEGDAYIRSKRQENTDIMKGLEKSGDLTVSGNKSPLASSENEAEVEKKRNKDQTSTTCPDKVKREEDNVAYQKQIEQNIQAKIDAIKEQVKREIAALKAKGTPESQRRKRDVNTLLIEENSALDPQKHPDEKLVPHIRQRRNLESLQPRKRAKRGLPDFSNLKNIDTGDYLDLAGEKRRGERQPFTDYEVDPQENKYLPENLEGSSTGFETKRDLKTQEDSAEAANLNINNKDNSIAQAGTLKLREGSVSNQLVEKRSVTTKASANEVKEYNSASEMKINDAQVVCSKNQEVTAAEENHDHISQEAKVNNDVNNSILKRNVNDQPYFEENINQKDQSFIENNSVNKDEIELKKRSVEVTTKTSSPDEKESGDTNTQVLEQSLKSDDSSSLTNLNEQISSSIQENKNDKRSVGDQDLQNIHENQKEEVKLSRQDTLSKTYTGLQAELAEQEQPEANLLRKRRQVEEEMTQNNQNVVYGRRKRANAIIPYAKSSYHPYRFEDEDGGDEGDEFDDDSFEDRSNLQKRDVGYNSQNSQFRRSSDYQNFDDYTLREDYPANYQPIQKRSLASKYVARENSDVYENPTNYLYQPSTYIRQKRQNFNELAALHGGGPMLHHLAAVRERNMQQLDDSSRSKRNFNKNGQNAGKQTNKEEPENIADLSASDLFGALPQSYDGNNLLRFKRVKRDLSNNKEVAHGATSTVKVV